MAGVPDVFWSAMRATSGMTGGRWGRDLCLWSAARSPSASGGKEEIKHMKVIRRSLTLCFQAIQVSQLQHVSIQLVFIMQEKGQL